MPPNPLAEDAIDEDALAPYQRPPSAFNFEAWQTEQPPLLPRSPIAPAAAPSTDSDPDAIIHSAPLQFYPQRKGKAPTRDQTPAPTMAEFRSMRAQIQNLQKEKEAALRQVQQIQDQHADNTGLLQRTAANVQNTANAAASQNTHLSASMSNQLQHIQDLVTAGFAQVNADLRRSFQHHQVSEERHQEYNRRFAGIEE